jgi:phosphoribosylglycinamide formyltransferase-1
MNLVVLISGNGSNLQAIIDRIADGFLTVNIAAVISNNKDAFGLQRAIKAGIPTHILENKKFATRIEYDQALLNLVRTYEPDLIVLAGFMRILTSEFVKYYSGRILNIHPSLLPKYRGLNTHARVLAAGDKEHGASVHFVTETLDDGPVILQAKVPVLPTDNVETLAGRVLEQEHKIYPEAIKWYSQQRIMLSRMVM